MSSLPPLKDDLIEIGAYIASDNPARALSFMNELEAKARQITEHPQAIPSRDGLAAGLRCAVHGRYLLFFRDSVNEVWRICFLWPTGSPGPVEVEIVDYHQAKRFRGRK